MKFQVASAITFFFLHKHLYLPDLKENIKLNAEHFNTTGRNKPQIRISYYVFIVRTDTLLSTTHFYHAQGRKLYQSISFSFLLLQELFVKIILCANALKKREWLTAQIT